MEQAVAQITPPVQLAPKYLAQERDKRISFRILHRLEELKRILHSTFQPHHHFLFVIHPLTVLQAEPLPEDLRLKALIEEKQLRLLSLQKKVREQIAHHLRHEIALQASADALVYRRSSRKVAQ